MSCSDHTDSPSGNHRIQKEFDSKAEKSQIASEELFQGASEIVINHAGEQYRLRLTKNDKLILHK